MRNGGRTIFHALGVKRSYRYVTEGIKVLIAQARTCIALADEGWSHVILDGKLFATDRLTETTTSVQGESLDAWYSGKHRDFGANIQAVMRLDGLPVWTSEAMPGHLHDLSCAHRHAITGTLYWAAAHLHLPTLADSGYEGTVHGIHTPRTHNPPTAARAPGSGSGSGCRSAGGGTGPTTSPTGRECSGCSTSSPGPGPN